MLQTESKGRKKSANQVCEVQETAATQGAEQTRPLAVTIENAAKLLSVSRSTAYKAAKEAKLPTFEFMGKTLVSVTYLEELVAQRTATAVAAMQEVIG